MNLGGIVDRNIELLEAFKKELCDIENHWFLFIGFFDEVEKNTRREILYPSSPMFFNLVKLRFHDHIVMQLAKLLDPKETGGAKSLKTNLSFKRLLHDLAPFSEDIQKELYECLATIEKNAESIIKQRQKRIAHNDLENKLNRKLPELEISKIATVLDTLEHAFNLMSVAQRGRSYKFFPVNVTDEMKPEHLVKIITEGRSSLGI